MHAAGGIRKLTKPLSANSPEDVNSKENANENKQNPPNLWGETNKDQ